MKHKQNANVSQRWHFLLTEMVRFVSLSLLLTFGILLAKLSGVNQKY